MNDESGCRRQTNATGLSSGQGETVAMIAVPCHSSSTLFAISLPCGRMPQAPMARTIETRIGADAILAMDQ